MRTSWAGAARLGLVFLGAAGAAHAAPLPIAPSYRLNGHLVHAPAAALAPIGPPTLLLTATQASLRAALLADGWQPAQDGHDGALPPLALPLAFVRPAVANEATHQVQARILAWQVGDNPDGPGQIWYVRLLHPGPPGGHQVDHARALAQAEADVALRNIFLTGTSRLAVATPVARNQRALPWVRLRHAATELRLAPPVGSIAECSPKLTDARADMPIDAQIDATSTSAALFVKPRFEGVEDSLTAVASMRTPGPEAGPACEDHGVLPVHPLAADQVASSVVWHSATTGKQIALTFDACSTFAIGRFNPRVVAALRANNVPATLFVGGHWAEMYPTVLEDLAQDPLFEIGNHTYSHPHMRDLSPQAQRQELLWTQELIFERTGKVPRLFRPPYGEVDDQLITTAAQNGLYTIEYDLPAGDADDHVTKAHLTQWIVGRSTPGSIVVMHMCRPNNHTADALPGIVRRLRDEGYSFCQVSDMLHHGGAGCR